MRRPFWLGSGVIFLDEVLCLAILPLLPLFVTKLDLSRLDVALMIAAYPLFMLASSIPAGLLADRIGSRKLLVVGSVLLVAASLGFAYAESEWQLWVARALQGLTSGLTSTAGMAVIAHGAPSHRRATVIGLAVSVQGLSTLAGPALGGFLAPAVGIEAAFLVPAGASLVLLVGLAWPGWPLDDVPHLSGWGGWLTTSFADPAVRAAVVTLFAVGFAQGAVHTLVPLSLSDAGYTVSALGALFLAGALVGLVLAPLAGRFADAVGAVRVTAIAFVLVPALLLGVGLAPLAWIAAGSVVLLWPLLRTGGSLGFALAAERPPLGGGLATAYGLTLAAWSLGAVVGPLAAGGVAQAAGDELGYVTVAALTGLLAAALAGGRLGAPARCPS